MSSKLYVGNLSYNTSEASIKTLFGQHGEVVSVNLITDRDTGRPKGFGFVEMATPEEAEAAKTAVNGTELDGRTLKVDIAKEMQPRPPRSGGYGGGMVVAAATAVAVAATVAVAAATAARRRRAPLLELRAQSDPIPGLVGRRPLGRRPVFFSHLISGNLIAPRCSRPLFC